MRKTIVIMLIAIVLLTVQSGAYNLFPGEDVEVITILSSSDIHGMLDGYDYYRGINLPVGLNRVSTIIKKQRLMDKDVILLDGGDFNRGNPMIDMYNILNRHEINPMINAMNTLKYDTAVLGNHELDYGKEILLKIKNEASFPLLSANIFYNDELLFKPYTVIERKGIRIGIAGFTTSAALRYNSGDGIEGISVRDIPAQAEKYMDMLRNQEKVDIVIALVHSGIEGIYKAPSDETDVLKVAELPVKPDVIISGHSHMVIPEKVHNGVLIQSPGALGLGLGSIRLSVKRTGGSWQIVKSQGAFIPAFMNTHDKDLDKLIKEYKESAVSYLNTSVGSFNRGAEYGNNELIDMIKQKDTGADVVIGERLKEYPIDKSDFKIKDLYKLYGRENYIVGVETGSRNIKEYVKYSLKNGKLEYNNLYPLDVEINGENIELYRNGSVINDGDPIKVALTGRQLKYDNKIKKSGISSGRLYYDSTWEHGVLGRVRQRIIFHLSSQDALPRKKNLP